VLTASLQRNRVTIEMRESRWSGVPRPRGLALASGLLVLAFALTLVPDPSEGAFPAGINGKILFSRSDSGQADIWAMNADGSGQVNSTNTPAPANEEAPAFSPNGRTITYSRGEAGQVDVLVRNADGSGQTNLTNTAAPVNEEGAVFSPDGSRIAFRRYNGMGPADIWVMNADGSGQINLTNTADPLDEAGPDFSPDGRTISFARHDGNQPDIWLMNADG
jgi:Tol biopolymer transport system component